VSKCGNCLGNNSNEAATALKYENEKLKGENEKMLIELNSLKTSLNTSERMLQVGMNVFFAHNPGT
jgi:hypothetical protein